MRRVMKGYRFVTDDLCSKHGDVQWQIGQWKEQTGLLKLCENGLHASKEPLDSLDYVFGNRWFIVEARGKILQDNDKFCASQMRLIREIPIKVLVQFAVDCAKRVLPIYQKAFPGDKRPEEAITVAERWLNEPTEAAARATRAAARAAENAAGAAARAAENAAGAAARATEAASWAAGTAARAAEAAAGAVARATKAVAAGAVARAAKAVAGAAARAAEVAAWAASWAAEAAEAATEARAERKWQNNHLKQLIKEAR